MQLIIIIIIIIIFTIVILIIIIICNSIIIVTEVLVLRTIFGKENWSNPGSFGQSIEVLINIAVTTTNVTWS